MSPAVRARRGAGRSLEKVLFFSSAFAFDLTLGGVRTFRLWAQALAARGVEVEYVCGSQVGFADGAARSPNEPANLRELAAGSGLRSRPLERRGPWEFVHRGVRFHVAHDRYRFESLVRASDASMRSMLRAVQQVIARFEPDLLVTICFSGRDALIHKLALSQGCPVGHVVSTVDIVEPEAIEFSLGVMGLSEYSVREFRRALNLRGRALHVLPPSVEVPRRSGESAGRFVTFVNPIEEKGLELFLELVRRFATELPRQRFLVVESRGTAEQVRRARGVDLHALPNVVVQPATRDMAAVYRRTKVLLVPSLWREAYGMVVTEAQLRGIPVLASNRGGLPEALQGASRPLPPLAPADAPQRRRRIIELWAGELRKLLLDERHHRACVGAAKRAAAAYRRTQSPESIHAAFSAFHEDLARRRLSADHHAHLERFRAQIGVGMGPRKAR